jgi:hypothetical protein
VRVPAVPAATVNVVAESVRVKLDPVPVENDVGAMLLHADRQAASTAAAATVAIRLVIPSSTRNQAPGCSPSMSVRAGFFKRAG